MFHVSFYFHVSGVEDVRPNVEAKEVLVDAAEGVQPQALVDALKKWSESSGKSVALA